MFCKRTNDLHHHPQHHHRHHHPPPPDQHPPPPHHHPRPHHDHQVSLGDWLEPSCIRPLLIAFTLMFFFQVRAISHIIFSNIIFSNNFKPIISLLIQECVVRRGNMCFGSNKYFPADVGDQPYADVRHHNIRTGDHFQNWTETTQVDDH